MVDSLWFVLALVLLAVVSVALVLVLGGGALCAVFAGLLFREYHPVE